MTKKVLLAIDVQQSFYPPKYIVEDINKLAAKIPTAATVFEHDEALFNYPKTLDFFAISGEKSQITNAEQTFVRHSYLLPKATIEWLKQQQPDEVLVCGLEVDINILAVGFQLFDLGFKAGLLVPLCASTRIPNEPTVAMNIWQRSIGHVYMSVVDATKNG